MNNLSPSESPSTHELENEKLMLEVKDLKRSNKNSQIVLFITLAVSIAGIVVPFFTEKEKMTHEEIKLFQDLSSDYYDLVDKDANGFLEEKFVITSRMIVLLDKNREEELLYSHISNLHKKAKEDFKNAKILISSLKEKKEQALADDPVVDTAVEIEEDRLKQAKEIYDDIVSDEFERPEEVREKVQQDLIDDIDALQQNQSYDMAEETSVEEIPEVPIDSTSFFVTQSLEVQKKLFKRSAVVKKEKEVNVLQDKVHWFKEGYYVLIDLDTVQYAVWLDELNKTESKVNVSLWSRNTETQLLEKIPNSNKTVDLEAKTNWTNNDYHFEFKFMEIERAGKSRSKAAYFNMKVYTDQ